MQVNLARLLSLDKFEQLPAHEAYPGHHYMFTQVEQHLVKKRFGIEFAVVNTYSPYSFVAEGGAEWGAQSLMWGDLSERLAFVKTLVTKLRELALAEEDTEHVKFISEMFTDKDLQNWVEVAAITDPLDAVPGSVHCHIAQKLVDGDITMEEARKRMQEDGFRRDDSWPNAAFLNEMEAYIINYSFAKTAVHSWIQAQIESGKTVTNGRPLHSFRQSRCFWAI